MKSLAAAGIMCLGLCACGPKEIGEGYSVENGAPTDATAADQMRLPMTGASNTERMLYYYNRPDVMEQVRDMQLYRFNSRLGIKPSPEDPAYRAVPKQRSPFRQ